MVAPHSILAAALSLFLAVVSGSAENWPQWRGPRADGISTERGFPVRWSRIENISWAAPLPGRGASTPIVWGDRVLVTSQVGEGPMETRLPRDLANVAPWEDPARRSDTVVFVIQAFRRSDGSLLWEHRLEAEGELPAVYPSHNLASPSLVTDGTNVYAWFGTGQLAALDLSGKLLWERHLGKEYLPFRVQRGHASSPVLYRDALLLLIDHTDASLLLSLDAATGKERFKVDRGRGRRSYSTPLIASGPNGDELIVNSSERIDAYDPTSGGHLWHAGAPVQLSAPTPVADRGILYLNRGYTSSPYLALRLGGRGDVAESHLLWRVPNRGPYVSSLLFYEGWIYLATERGIAYVVDPTTGETVWRQRLGGVFTASPVAAEGRVYFLTEDGETIVLAAGREPRILARNDLGERCLASPALSGGQIFIRSDEHLFAIADSGARSP